MLLDKYEKCGGGGGEEVKELRGQVEVLAEEN